MADEIPFEDLPEFLKMLLGPTDDDNPALSWKAPRPPVSLPPPLEPHERAAAVPAPAPVKAAAPRVPPRPPRQMPSADPRNPRSSQGSLF